MQTILATWECDAFEVLLSLFNLAIQFGLLLVAGAAALYAKAAFETQDKTLVRLIQADRQKQERERISASPFFVIAVAAAQIADELEIGDRKRPPVNLLLSTRYATLPVRFSQNPDLPQSVDLLLENRRPSNAIMSLTAESGDILTLSDPFRVQIKSPNGSIPGDHWILRYKISKEIFDSNSRARIALTFETIAGHYDTHIYEHLLGHAVWKRIDPPMP